LPRQGISLGRRLLIFLRVGDLALHGHSMVQIPRRQWTSPIQ
jgi:hypothetical protein